MAPRTTKEALIAEMLGDIDVLLTRSEALASKVEALQTQITASTATLDAAGERYRATIITFTEQAKQKLVSHVERKAGEAATKLLDSQAAEIRDAVHRALEVATGYAVERKQQLRSRIAELAGVALLAGASAAGLTYWFVG